MIRQRVIPEFRVKHYAPDGSYIGLLNVYEAEDLLGQLEDEPLQGYYAEFEGQKLMIEALTRIGGITYIPFNPFICQLNRIKQKYLG
jgi:hypothetical protein